MTPPPFPSPRSLRPPPGRARPRGAHRRVLTGIAAAAILAACAAAAVAAASEDPPDVLVLSAQTDPDTRAAIGVRIRQHVGEAATVEWMTPTQLVEIWREPLVYVRAPTWEGCAGEPWDAAGAATSADRALAALDGGRDGEARSLLDSFERELACASDVVPGAVLQRTRILLAWLALRTGDAGALERSLQGAVAVDPDMPGSLRDTLPADLLSAFEDFAEEVRHRPHTSLEVTTSGLPVDVYVDGRALRSRHARPTRGDYRASLAPGDHLVQIVRPGPAVETVLVHAGSDGGDARVRVVTPVPGEDVDRAVEAALDAGEISALLEGLLATHAASRRRDLVVLARSGTSHRPGRVEVLPLSWTEDERFEPDAELAGALRRGIVASTGDAHLAVRKRREGPVRSWRIRAGAGGGVALVQGFLYGAPAAEFGLESPAWLGTFVRTGATLRHADHSHIQASVAGLFSFRPSFGRLGLRVAIGAELRGPDHRFTAPGVHPVLEGGVELRVATRVWLSATADVVLYRVRDASIRLSLSREFPLRPAVRP